MSDQEEVKAKEEREDLKLYLERLDSDDKEDEPADVRKEEYQQIEELIQFIINQLFKYNLPEKQAK